MDKTELQEIMARRLGKSAPLDKSLSDDELIKRILEDGT